MSQNAEKILQNRSYADTAEVLFLKRGVIDKETFGCYFRSKDALMDSVIAGVMKADQEEAQEAGVFHAPYPREIMDFLLTASSMIFVEDLFGWNEDAHRKGRL